MDFISILNDPAVRSAVLGLVVKLAVDFLKHFFSEIDANGNKQYKVQVQLLVAVCSLVASFGGLYLSGQLHTADPQVLVNFFTVVLPTYISALGIHHFASDVKNGTK